MVAEEAPELLTQVLAADHRAGVWCAAQCARTALHDVPEGEDRPRVAIETAEAWVRGEATPAAAEAAAIAAEAAARRAASAAARHSGAAYAAAYAAEAAHLPSDIVPDVYDAYDAYDAAYLVATHADQAASENGHAGRFADLYGLVSAVRWPLTRHAPERLRGAPEAVRVAWDLVATDDRTAHAIPELLAAHARAARLGLDWSDPVQRAVAERATDEALEARVRAILQPREDP